MFRNGLQLVLMKFSFWQFPQKFLFLNFSYFHYFPDYCFLLARANYLLIYQLQTHFYSFIRALQNNKNFAKPTSVRFRKDADKSYNFSVLYSEPTKIYSSLNLFKKLCERIWKTVRLIVICAKLWVFWFDHFHWTMKKLCKHK